MIQMLLCNSSPFWRRSFEGPDRIIVVIVHSFVTGSFSKGPTQNKEFVTYEGIFCNRPLSPLDLETFHSPTLRSDRTRFFHFILYSFPYDKHLTRLFCWINEFGKRTKFYFKSFDWKEPFWKIWIHLTDFIWTPVNFAAPCSAIAFYIRIKVHNRGHFVNFFRLIPRMRNFISLLVKNRVYIRYWTRIEIDYVLINAIYYIFHILDRFQIPGLLQDKLVQFSRSNI